jgi:hypothetical protein
MPWAESLTAHRDRWRRPWRGGLGPAPPLTRLWLVSRPAVGHDAVVGAAGAGAAGAGAVPAQHLRGGPAVRLHQVSLRAAAVQPGMAEMMPEPVRPGIHPGLPAAAGDHLVDPVRGHRPPDLYDLVFPGVIPQTTQADFRRGRSSGGQQCVTPPVWERASRPGQFHGLNVEFVDGEVGPHAAEARPEGRAANLRRENWATDARVPGSAPLGIQA